MNTLDGQVALVTDSSRGIGAAVAAELARCGAAVAVHGRDQAATAGVADAISRGGGKAMTVTGDVTDFGQVEGVRSPIPDAAAKAGIALLTQDVAAQAGPFGIRANCIAPETIMTGRNQEQIPAELQATMAGWHPLKRLGTPEDVATAAFLASDDASWITGVVIDVADGAVMR